MLYVQKYLCFPGDSILHQHEVEPDVGYNFPGCDDYGELIQKIWLFSWLAQQLMLVTALDGWGRSTRKCRDLIRAWSKEPNRCTEAKACRVQTSLHADRSSLTPSSSDGKSNTDTTNSGWAKRCRHWHRHPQGLQYCSGTFRPTVVVWPNAGSLRSNRAVASCGLGPLNMGKSHFLSYTWHIGMIASNGPERFLGCATNDYEAPR